MQMSKRGPWSFALCLVGASLLHAEEARATDATEVPDNGSEQSGRGGAWVARASDPLAAFYNPAGLAGQPSRLILQANLGSQRTCFTRMKGKNDMTSDGVAPGGTYPQVCDSAAYSPDPQLAMTFRISPRVGIGFIPFLGPSAANGNASYPEFATVGTNGPNQPEPGRYLLTAQSVILVTPTLGIGAEIIDRLRVGASFQWGIAQFSFTSATAAENQNGVNPLNDDIKAQLTGHEYFIPGFTLGTIWSPIDSLDVAGWYKFSAPINATGDVKAQYPYYAETAAGSPSQIANTDTSQANCGFEPTGTACGKGGNASVHLARPMEAKVGIRFHMPRKGIPYDEHTRDPMAQDQFDIEADFTWANDSAMDSLQIRFPASADGAGLLPVNLGGGLTSSVPPNADIPLHYSDVLGIRVGGDWNILPDQLAARAGAFYQTPAQTGTNTQYQGLAFATGSQVGLALGGTYRIHFGPGANALELSAGFEHVFLGQESYDGSGGIDALAGTPCNPTVAKPPASGTCPSGTAAYRTNWAVNLGTITNSVNIINAGLGYRF
jgi:long-subunit fatty acid transport protein